MPVVVPIVEVVGSDQVQGRGEYELQALPAPGDKIVLPGPAGDLQIAQVLYTEHAAIRLPKGKFTESEESSATVYVEITDMDPDGSTS